MSTTAIIGNAKIGNSGIAVVGRIATTEVIGDRPVHVKLLKVAVSVDLNV